MRVTKLTLANVRAIREAEFTFQPGFNLIVGVNGVGKTTVLDALRVCLSAIVGHTNKVRVPAENFGPDDIRVGADSLTLNCRIALAKSEYEYIVHRPREGNVPQKKNVGMPREETHRTPSRSEFLGEPPKPATGQEPLGRPFAVLFSTSRAVPSDRSPRRGTAAGGIAGAFGEALVSRELRLAEFADWMRVQEAFSAEKPSARAALAAFARAVKRFLPSYSNLRMVGNGRPSLMIDRGKTPLNVRQLSDGERGTLALVLDITRRLAQANPHLTDPAEQAEAVVLIDEIDLHLHPKWQRQIVRNLTTTFPKCQFIATTHSPQVVGEVTAKHVVLMHGDGRTTYPSQAFGMDSNWILRHIMESDERRPEVKQALDAILAAIRSGDIENARAQIADVRGRIGESPDLAAADAMASRAEILSQAPPGSRRRKAGRRGTK